VNKFKLNDYEGLMKSVENKTIHRSTLA